MIRIRSQSDGFIRCGLRHSSSWTEYPDDVFSPEQLAILKAEPMLQVEVVAPKNETGGKSDGGSASGPGGSGTGAGETSGEGMTKAQILARLTELGVEIPKGVNKPELQALLDEALAKSAEQGKD